MNKYRSIVNSPHRRSLPTVPVGMLKLLSTGMVLVLLAGPLTAVDCLSVSGISAPSFSDVYVPLVSANFIPLIEEAAASGLMTGCGDGFFCPGAPVTRGDMAIYLERLIHYDTPTWTPPLAVGLFDDVPASSCYACWIEELFNDGVTQGCMSSPLKYCPNRPVNRAQMAVFLVASWSIVTGNPMPTSADPCQGTFSDVACSNNYRPFIEKIAELGITQGCGGGNFCPDLIVPRDQMAVFLVATRGTFSQ